MNKVVINQDKCKGCGLCVEFCTKKALAISGNFNRKGLNPVELAHEDLCISCGLCTTMCPDACISVYKPEPVNS